MGQRLVVTIKNEGNDIAKIYYHWSAYSVSALMEARDIVNYLQDIDYNTEKELQLALIRFCENHGGGIKGGSDDPEWKHIQEMFPDETFKSDGINRTYGLIALSENGMDDLQDWSEGDLDIILDEGLILNYVYWGYEGIEEYKEHRDDDFDSSIKLEDIIDIGCDLCEICFDEIDDVIAKLNVVEGFVVRYGNEIFELIA